jgi:RND superfamily putative drug exporter
MTTLLYRLGRFCHRRKFVVLTIWLVILLATGTLAVRFSGKTSEEFRVPGTEAQIALDRLALTLPEYSNSSAQIVFAAPRGDTVASPENRKAIQDAVAAIGRTRGVLSVQEPFSAQAVSQDGKIALAPVLFAVKTKDLGQDTKDAVRRAADSARSAGLQVEFGGDAYTPTVEVEGGEAVGIGVAVLVLLVTFGSLVAAGLPMLSALFGVGVAMAGLLALTGRFEIISTAPVLALMIGMAVSIDYALFIVSRHRQNLADGMESEEAAARANGTAGSAVVFAGATVVAALAGLAVAQVPFLTVMGASAAAAVVIAVLAAVTLLPALLGFAGRSVGRARPPKLRKNGDPRPGLGERWARVVVRRPLIVLLACLAGTAVVAVPARDLRLGLPSAGSYAETTTARRAFDLVSQAFGPGFNGPLLTVVDAAGTKRPDLTIQLIASRLPLQHGVATVLPPTMDKSGKLAVIPVIPADGPDTNTTADLISDIRGQRALLRRAGVDMLVSGSTAANIDVAEKLGGALPPFILTIAGIALVLLSVAFRSLLIPLKAVLSFLLSVAATAGAVVAVYQMGWFTQAIPVPKTGPVVAFLPILLIGVLFGLAMDYELFLVSRMKEEYDRGAEPRDAVISGFAAGARVVTAAAIIMVSVFGSFVFGHDPIVQPIGFALATGVVIDAFIVRMTLVPAVMALLGKAAWWFPRFLERLVPKIDVEGEGLSALPAEEAPAKTMAVPSAQLS